ncbi:MAG TPA: ribosome biogenesis GTP-binding protein YihA/YsxC [Gemmatimonadota bacterium]|nr:ribosome biogenesis GTP-binding protein YihA/YsxC [Gemmatimonadota bacterium]
MRLGEAAFIGAVRDPGDALPTRLPQVAVIGRSNVGKSSLINAILGRKALARVSRTPGRTQEIHFYEVDGRFCLVDLPGYGFARVPAQVRQRWGPLIQSYLSTSRGLVGVILLLDARHGPSRDDRRMLDFLERLELPTLFVLTKIDKLSRGKRKAALAKTLETLEIPEDQLLATSAVTGEGTKTLSESLLAAVEESG